MLILIFVFVLGPKNMNSNLWNKQHPPVFPSPTAADIEQYKYCMNTVHSLFQSLQTFNIFLFSFEILFPIREDINKKTFSFGHCPNKGGWSSHADFFGPFSRSAFLVNKKSIFLQKCQCIALLVVFLGCFRLFKVVLGCFRLTFKSWILTSEKRGPSCPNWGHGGGLGNSGNARKKTFFFNWCLP